MQKPLHADYPQFISAMASIRLFYVLLALNTLLTILVVITTFHNISGDHHTYLGYADGLLKGRYSYWYFLPDYVPDTLRNPGYPFFLYLLKALGLGESGIRLTQVILYFITVAILLKVAQRCEMNGLWLVRNIFLLLLLPNLQVAYFASVIFPEILVAFLVAIYILLVVSFSPISWVRTISLALIAGLIFQTRPVFIFFPLIQLAIEFWQFCSYRKYAWSHALLQMMLFGATMLPYGVWNYRHHGVFKLTPLEGGAGVMQIGFWALRMPGYTEHRYWGNRMGEEVIQFAPASTVPAYIAAFNHEWDIIEVQLRPLLTASDKRNLLLMQEHPELFPTYNSVYTKRREQLLMQANLANIRREPGYYFKTRLYTLVRLWVTGLQRDSWHNATGLIEKLKVLYPTIVSGITFILAVLSIGWAAWRGQISNKLVWYLSMALIVYFGIMHLPFAIQARYTVPVRLWLLLSISLAIQAWLTRRSRAIVPLI